MRAWQTTKAGRPRDVLVLNESAPSPKPRDGTVRLRVLCAGIGLPDALMCQANYALTPPLPFTQGQEVVGRVFDWGADVKGRRAGDRVMAVTSFFTGNGSFAEECLALDDFCLPVPDDMTDAEAACFSSPATPPTSPSSPARSSRQARRSSSSRVLPARALRRSRSGERSAPG
jgi:NADPH2:quinone reductase